MQLPSPSPFTSTTATIITWLPILVNVVLALLVIWYTLETRWLRKQNQEQLELLKQQGIKSLAPFILPSIINYSTKLKQWVDASPIIDKEYLERELQREEFKQGVKYLGNAENLTDNLALNVQLYVFEAESQTFLKGLQDSAFMRRDSPQPRKMFIDEWSKSLEFVTTPTETKVEIEDKPFSGDVLKRNLSERYAPHQEWLMNEIMRDVTSSFILAVYTDVEGNPYFVRRRFHVDEHDFIAHHAAIRIGPPI